MPRTPTQRAHPASAVHPYTNPGQSSYDHVRQTPRQDPRSPEMNRDVGGSSRLESTGQTMGDQLDSTVAGGQQQQHSSNSGTTSAVSGPSSSPAGAPTSSNSSNSASGSGAAPDSSSSASAQPATSSNGVKKKHVCPTCDRGFTTSGHLARHARVHTGERNHKCPFPGCETRCSRQDNLQQHYRIHLSPGSRRSASSAARAAAQNKAAAAAAASMATSPIQTSPVSGTLGPDDGPPPLAQAHPGLHPPALAQATPYAHGGLAQSYPPLTMQTSPHLQNTNGVSAYAVPQTPPAGSYEVGAQQHQQNGTLTNGHAHTNGSAPVGLGQSPPESPASHSTPSTGPSAHVPLPPSSYPSQYMNYPGYTPSGPAPKISTFYQRHHYPPEAYVPPTNAHTQTGQPAIPSSDQRYQQPQSALHHSPDMQLVEKERRRNRPSISSISSGQSPSQSPVITNGRLGHLSDRSAPPHHDTGHWQSAYGPYSSGGGSAGPHASNSAPSTNGDGNYNITAPSAGSYSQATPSQTHSSLYSHPHGHSTPSTHYEVHSPPPLPPPQSTGSTASTNSVSSGVLSEASHASSHTSYMSHMNGSSDHGHGHEQHHPHSGLRSPPPILAPIQSSLRGDPTNSAMGNLGMGLAGYHHVSALPGRHHLHNRPYGQVGYALETGYAGVSKGYDG